MNFGFVLFEEVHKDKPCTMPQSQAVQCKVLWAEQLPGKTLYPGSGRVHLHFACQPSRVTTVLAGGAAVAGWLSGLTPACLGVYPVLPTGVCSCGLLGGVPFGDQGVIYLCGPFCPVSFTAPIFTAENILHVLS